MNPSNSALPQAPLNAVEGTEKVSEITQTTGTSVASYQHDAGMHTIMEVGTSLEPTSFRVS